MFRRVLALLLLLMCGVSVASADAYRVDVTCDVLQQDGLLHALQDAGMDSPRPETVQALADFIAGLSLRFQVQDEGVYLALMHERKTLLDMGVYADSTDGYVTSTFLPKHYLHVVTTADEAAAAQAAEHLLEEMEWAALAADMLAALSERSISMTVEKGSFMGDAYDHGAQRTTLRFSDVELANAVEDALSVLAKYGINDQLLEALIGEEGLLAGLHETNRQIAANDEYSYVLHLVEDRNGMPIGVSLVTMQDDVQVMSLSLGFGDNGYRAVWGYGLNHENIYIDLILIEDEQPGKKEFALTVYVDPARSGFRAVEPFYDYVQQMYAGTFTLTENEVRTAWSLQLESYGQEAAGPEAAWLVEGELLAEHLKGKQTIGYYPAADLQAGPSVVITCSLAACEPEAWNMDGLTPIDMDDPEADANLSNLMGEAAANLLVELFRLLPAELLTNLMF